MCHVGAMLAVIGLTAVPRLRPTSSPSAPPPRPPATRPRRAGDHPGGGPGDRRHAALRHQQQGARRPSSRRQQAGPSRARDWRAPTPRRSSTARSRRPTTRAATWPSLLGDHQVALILLAYDGTAADPVSAFTSAAETVNRATHTTPVANVGDRRLLRRLLLGRQVRLRPPPAGPFPPVRPSAASRSAPAPAASPRSPPTCNAPVGTGCDHPAHRHQRRLDGQGDDVDRRAPGRPDRRTPTSPRWPRSP